LGVFWKPYIGQAVGGELDWWRGRAGCYPIGDEYVAEEKKLYFFLSYLSGKEHFLKNEKL
jgi:hypothetical protein